MTTKFKYRYLLAFGSNLSPKKINCLEAMFELKRHGQILKKSIDLETTPLVSDIYNTKNQKNYLNLIIDFATDLTPSCLYKNIRYIEDAIGHDRKSRWQSRKIDVDILYWFNNFNIELNRKDLINYHSDKLLIPHAEIKNRDFIIYLLSSLGFSPIE